MNQTPANSKPRWFAAIFAIAAVLVICAVAVWKFGAANRDRRADADVASSEVVAHFFKSLAALDVEESELAARELEEVLQKEPREPALWANLAVARLRLQDMESARDALQQALSLAGDARELHFLNAELMQQSGEIEPAIEQLRKVHHQWPENIAVTYSLASLLGQIRNEEADQERLSLLSDILARAPGNLRVRCEQARAAATLERGEELRAAIDALSRQAGAWPDAAKDQLAQADRAAQANEFQNAARSLTFMENILKPRPEYQQSLAPLGVGSTAAIGTPLRTFLHLKLPSVEAADADIALTFKLQAPTSAALPDLVLAMEQAGQRRPILMSLSGNALQAGESAALPFPGSSVEAIPSSIGVADLDSDFQQDLILVGTQGCRIFLGREDGSFAQHEAAVDELARPWRSVWAVDVEADGDLDLLLSDHESPLRWVRNNGDTTFTATTDFIPAANIRELLAIDLDGDGDVDLATLDQSGSIAVWQNERSGRYVAAPTSFVEPRIAMATGDVDRDGRFDLISVSKSGQLRQATRNDDGTWDELPLTRWSPAASLAGSAAGDVFLAIADVDNNGGVDLIASTSYETAIWLRGTNGQWTKLAETPALRVTSLADMDDDGLLDLIGLTEQGARIALNQSQAGYGWHVVQPMASTAGGDSRINSFGIGGRIEIRAGNLVQAAAIRSPCVHFGLGRHELADVARIVWPNGTVQAEFDLQAKERLVANQRLKGSCPWVFAFDGQEFHFVKDFLWRSPLGLRINAQTTAGVVQTEDWIKIPGRQLAAVDGRYRVRITAELWETHFFDQVALLAVDHPPDVDVLVDERFVPSEAPIYRVIVTTPRQPLRDILNHRGHVLDETLHAIDGQYADGFALGQYQGVAEEHWVEFDVPTEADADRRVLLVGNGWVYPTDSSLNVALAQASVPRPFGLVLEQRDANGKWHLLRDGLGFPAGKNKDVVIALPDGSLAAGRRFRLRTNLEIYWDALGWCYEIADAAPQVETLPLRLAELRQRGYSKLLPTDRRRSDTPLYQVAGTEQRWLDLEGYYTRFGDVRGLLTTVDDRYVIMNAGDELVFEFEANDDLPDGWRRDFVLVGDGWVKDGDFNTAFSQWVQPLPTHGDGEYAGPVGPLEADPVYLRHYDDWRAYHTRYVMPRRFQRGLWPPTSCPAIGENQP